MRWRPNREREQSTCPAGAVATATVASVTRSLMYWFARVMSFSRRHGETRDVELRVRASEHILSTHSDALTHLMAFTGCRSIRMFTGKS